MAVSEMEFSLQLFKILACEILRNTFVNISEMLIHLSHPSPIFVTRETTHDADVTQHSTPYNMGS
jgi:hypothetical protein